MARRDGNRVVVGTLALCWLLLVVSLVLTLLPEFRPVTIERLQQTTIGFAAAVLAFTGGVRWGLRLQGGTEGRNTFFGAALTLAMVPVAMLAPYMLALALLVVGYGAMGAWDVWAADRSDIPERWGRLRARMTLAFALTLIALMIASRLVP